MTDGRDPRGVDLPLEREGTTRRTFLRLAGYGVATATLAACSRAPASKIVPRLESADGLVPGRRYRLATTCGGCPAGCGVLAEVRDGRPVKLEGNPGHPVNDGGLCAVGQAQVLSLYDGKRFDGPRVRGAAATWEAADAEVRAALASAKGRVRLLTGTDSSPSTRVWIDRFCREHGAKHVVHDAVPASAILEAHAATHGGRMLPRYRFDRARTIVSFGADFLGTWISPVEFARGWAAGRRPDGADASMSRHLQFESRVSLTGTNADRRVLLAPWETATALAELCAALAAKAGVAPPFPAPSQRSSAGDAVRDAAEALWASRPAALVVSDDDDRHAQILVNYANHLLGAYGTTLDLARPSLQRAGDVRAVEALLGEMDRGEVGVLIVAGANPLYDLPDAPRAREALGRVGLVVACAGAPDETTSAAAIVCPTPHALESWGDAEPFAGTHSLRQPAIRPLRSARTLRTTLSRWCGDSADDLALLRAHWKAAIHPVVAPGEPFDPFFARAVHDGFVAEPQAPRGVPEFRLAAVVPPAPRTPPSAGELALVLHAQVGIPDGSQAHNAWLQELPDPVTKVTWDNVAALSPATARAIGVEEGDVLRIAAEGGPAIEVPACVQPGQHDGVVAVALGYGRAGTDRFASVAPEWIEGRPTVEPGGVVGVAAAPLLALRDGALVSAGRGVRVEKTGTRRDLAKTQMQATLQIPEHLAPKGGAVRDAVRATTFAHLAAGHGIDEGHGAAAHAVPDLWAGRAKRSDVRWGLAIDLAKCIGCSGCVVSCQAENNVPVVGRDEVLRRRDMHWMRIDRYWTSDRGADGTAWHQPMMCQHCGNAPCETVCPVLATVHSAEGLNQQVYNRCVGTRYCANNCPYKVRRFNWFEYARDDDLANLALNPDVTVRSRGVMEKCSLCLQRILRARSDARREGREVRDGDVRTACQESCPTSAIVFGDLADTASEAARLAASGRSYRVLEEIRVEPGVNYLAAVRNPGDGGEGGGHGR